jgi:subtilase family serine protease
MRVLLFLVIAVISQVFAEYVRMESNVNFFSSRNWLKEKTFDENAEIKAIFVMKHDRSVMYELDKKLMDISNPSSPNYGKWMKREEIAEKMSPSQDKLKVVTDFVNQFRKSLHSSRLVY